MTTSVLLTTCSANPKSISSSCGAFGSDTGADWLTDGEEEDCGETLESALEATGVAMMR